MALLPPGHCPMSPHNRCRRSRNSAASLISIQLLNEPHIPIGQILSADVTDQARIPAAFIKDHSSILHGLECPLDIRVLAHLVLREQELVVDFHCSGTCAASALKLDPVPRSSDGSFIAL